MPDSSKGLATEQMGGKLLSIRRAKRPASMTTPTKYCIGLPLDSIQGIIIQDSIMGGSTRGEEGGTTTNQWDAGGHAAQSCRRHPVYSLLCRVGTVDCTLLALSMDVKRSLYLLRVHVANEHKAGQHQWVLQAGNNTSQQGIVAVVDTPGDLWATFRILGLPSVWYLLPLSSSKVIKRTEDTTHDMGTE